ncbi:N-acyl homoserine lactonase family protein [Isoptericola sp. b441]|uniref:N-acyl homoserine lactonase family protein n=1 Tax=Actinotalea lenta TaxID=3064654 RepID=A0ABT9D634_9CELL|nr:MULTISPECIES: N-acyl homoserine lactonase family protein [unclassified Isoptericola]MDO8106290.1 N-acyl homoserine lactonase family protein [Isoptericola sp. b441]MDO8121990.1 N-acyl homoserine lactonase family protein [Isoptericola sp. b490]
MTISRVSVLRVGEVQVRPDNVAGTWRPMLLWTATSRSWTDWLPVHVVVVEHDGGVLLFDTGQSPTSLSDPGYYPGGLVGWAFRRQARFRIADSDLLTARLASIGLSPDDVDTVVLSHLHQDHAGNVGLLERARVLVHADELALLDEKRPELHGVLPTQVEAARVQPVTPGPIGDLAPFDTGLDLRGDGSLVLLPTPGHSRGSMSLLVRRADAAPLLLVGDVTYDPALMADERIPGTGARATQLATTRAINRLREHVGDLRVIAAHDPAAPSLVT